MATIVIDAGHGGFDNGASYQGRREKDDTLALALEVGADLENAGYEVLFTRTVDEYQSPFEKAQIANDAGADYFISLHRNSGEVDNTYNGVQSLVYGDNPEAIEIANSINEQLEKTGFQNLGIEERTGLVVLRRTEMPAVLVEVGFVNNDRDNEIFDEKFDEVAEAIASGIEQAVPLEKRQSYTMQQDRDYAMLTEEDQFPDNREGGNDREISGDRFLMHDDEIISDKSRMNHPANLNYEGSNRQKNWNLWQDENGDTSNQNWRDINKDEVYGVEVGRFRNRNNADLMAEQMKDMGMLVFELLEEELVHVIVGRETAIENAVQLKTRLHDMGYYTMVVSFSLVDVERV